MGLFEKFPGSEELVDDVLSSLRACVVVTEVEGQILFASPGVEEVLGFTPAELKGDDFSVFFTPEDMQCLYPNLLYLARKGEPFEGDLMLRRKNGTRFFAFFSSRVWKDPHEGRPVMVIFVQDVDKLKQQEKTLRETNYDDLLKISDGIAHELRNPVVGIAGFVKKLYKSCSDDPESEKYYSYITDHLEKIEALVREVEVLAHLPKPCLVEEPMREVVEGALVPYHDELKEREIDLVIDIDETALFIDAELATQALSILIENAIDAVRGEGRITVHGQTEMNQYKIRVTDTGSGISPAHLPHVFDPFFSTKTGGAGISLAVLKRIMDIHGGSVKATSKQSEGATFLLVFPVERRRPIRVSLLEEEAVFSPKET
jgi:PAS domain S-box-containing protein